MRFLDETGLVAFWNKIKLIILDNEEVTAVSLNNLDSRVTSIRDDLENKADKSIIPTTLSDLEDDTSHRLVTDAEKTTWSAKVGEVELDKYNSDATESSEGTPANGQTDVKVDNVSIGTVVTSYAPGTAQRPYVAPSWYALNTKLSDKQDTISDLNEIRSGASKGSTAVQPTDIKDELDPGGNGEIADSAAIAAYLEDTIGTKADAITVEENELVTSAALNDLNSRINNLNTEKLDVLVSGTDIKTINNQSILGSGNIDITSDLGYSLVSMFSKLDEITPVRTIEFDVAATTGQIIYSRANVTEDDLLNNVTDTLIYSIEVSGNSNSNIYDLYKVYAHFQPCALRSPMTFIEHICKNPASSTSLYGLRLLTYYYPKAVNNRYPWICYLTAPSTDSRHIKIRVYQDSSNVDWKNPAIPVAVTEGLYNTTYLTKGSEMTITSTGWITNGITQASSTTATISTSLPKNFVGSIYQAGEALTGGNLVYRALNDGKIYRVGTLTTSIDNATVNLTLDPMFGISRIVNSRAINANIVTSDLDYKRSINPSSPNNGSSFQIETGWTKGDTMYYKCTQSGTSLIPTGHITTTLTPGYAYFPIGVINSASSLDFDCIGHEFITLNASGKVTHVNGLEIAGGSGGGSTVVVSLNTDPNEHAPLGTSIVVDGNSKSIITNTKPSGTQALLEAPSWLALEDDKEYEIFPLSAVVIFAMNNTIDEKRIVYFKSDDPFMGSFPEEYLTSVITELDNILNSNKSIVYVLLHIDGNPLTSPVMCIKDTLRLSILITNSYITILKNDGTNTWYIDSSECLITPASYKSGNDRITLGTDGILNLKSINNQSILGSGNITIGNNTPLLEKTYENYTCEAANMDKGYIYFMNIVPTSDNYFEPWYVHYILEITTSVNLCLGYYEITMGSAGTTSLYRHFNRLYSTSYIPTYYHLMAWHNSAAKYANKATYPIKLGERIYSAYGTTTVARTYNIKVIDMYNCTVTFPDNIETYDSFYSDSNYGYNSYWNAYSNGGMDNWDANTVPYLYYEHYPLYYIHSDQTPLYRYKICGFDDDNRLVPVTITNRTSAAASTLTPCKVPMAVSRGLVYYASTTNITDPTVLTANGVIYRGNEVGIEYFRYNFDTLPGNNLSVYLKGTYTISTDTFVLDDDYYVFVPTNVTSSSYSTYFTEGKYYWYVGRTGNYSTANYGGFNLNNPLYQFNGSKLVPITSIISTNGGSGDTNVIETVKVNGTALTPDANKAVDISIPDVKPWATNDIMFTSESPSGESKLYFSSLFKNASRYGNVYITLGNDNSTISTIFDSQTDDISWEHGGDTAIATVGLIQPKIDAKYTKPSTGIPKTDLATAVQTSLGKADTALLSYTETDPVFTASAAHDITSTDITNWNNKTNVIINQTGNETTGGTTIALDGNTAQQIVSNFELTGTNLAFVAPSWGAMLSALSGKLDTISDLATIRSNASAGAAKVSNVQADWNATSGLAQILNKPTIPTLNTNLFTVEQGTTSLNSTTSSLVDDLNDLSQAGDNTFPTSTAVYNAIVAAINAAKVTIYSGTAAPSNSQGTNGDLYLQTS